MKTGVLLIALLLPSIVLGSTAPKTSNIPADKIVRLEIVTAPFLVERKYKSMEGPVQSVFFTAQGIDDKGGKITLRETASARRRNVETRTGMAEGAMRDRQLWWFLGGEIEVLHPTEDKVISQEYMCHFNMEGNPTTRQMNFPESPSETSRMLTLTGGALRATFPPGYAVPTANDEPLQCVFQVLNHNTPGTLQVRHRFTLFYARDSDLTAEMKPLEFHSPFMALPVEKAGTGSFSRKIKTCSCCSKLISGKNAPQNTNMAIYDGPDGKPYTGHWVIPDGVSSAKFPFRQYAKSFGSYETTVHTIIPHVHPYAKTFDILKHDPKCGTSGVFYRANIENQDGVTGLKRMDIYSSSEGLKITPGEEYEFSLTYENTSGEFQDAMGSMFVYTHDKKWKRANWKNSEHTQFKPIDPSETLLEIKTTAGPMKARLFPKSAPLHVERILALVKARAYDGIRFANIMPGYVAQTDSLERKPDLTDAQNALIKSMPLEIDNKVLHTRGALSMARSPEYPNSATTSFCFMLDHAPHLNGDYTVFGQIVEGLDVLDRIGKYGANREASSLRIQSIAIVNGGAEATNASHSLAYSSEPFKVSFLNELISCGVVPLDKSKRAVDCAALDPKMEYLHIVTGVGEIAVELYPDVAPRHVSQVKRLADAGCYDGVAINRIEKSFVAQIDEVERNVNGLTPKQKALVKDLPLEVGETVKHARGVVSMARWEDPNSAQSSFSLVLGPAPHLDGKYTIFGKVVKGWEVLDKIEELAGAAPRKPKAVVPIYKIRSVKPTTREANADK
jgi:cyclophilin family peptidyl-prolyl cis-trans isomerase